MLQNSCRKVEQIKKKKRKEGMVVKSYHYKKVLDYLETF